MNLFDVYNLFEIEIEHARGSYVYDTEGRKYLDMYGGHAVISIGHSHPHFVLAIKDQIEKIGFYSNSVKIPLQNKLTRKLGRISGYEAYNLFLVNSGAEANENAFKLASFQNGRKKIISFKACFHGRTSLAVSVTDNPKIIAPVNENLEVIMLELNDEASLESAMDETICAVIIEGIQGVGGINVPSNNFLRKIKELCDQNNSYMIIDEIQSGYGRSGKFFAHQYADVRPHLITIAKGMANGFPVSGVLIHPDFVAGKEMLGTTFGGNHLACAAALSVLEVIEEEQLLSNVNEMSEYLLKQLSTISQIKEIRGKGLMIGIELFIPSYEIRNRLLFEHSIFTGGSSQPNTIRLLPALNIRKDEINQLIDALKLVLEN